MKKELLLGTIIGVATGYVVATILTPNSGEQNREIAKRRIFNLKTNVDYKINNLKLATQNQLKKNSSYITCKSHDFFDSVIQSGEIFYEKVSNTTNHPVFVKSYQNEGEN